MPYAPCAFSVAMKHKKSISITIDGKPITAQKGAKLLWVALDNGIDIPNLCAMKDQKMPSASCRLCFVEVKGKPEPVTACTEKVFEGIPGIGSKKAMPILEEELKGKNINIIQGDFLDYNFEKKYSLIVMFEVLEHIKNDEAALKKINELLQNNGLFILSVPAKIKKMGITDKIAGHYRRYEKENLIKLLKKNNFQIIEFASYGFPILNITTILRDIMFKINAKKIIGRQDKPEDMSKNSGMGYINYFQFKKLIKIMVNFLFTDKLLNFYVKILKPFNQYDLGDGYLCLVSKKNS